uniref:Uncharacterized protein n=1 Tax=Oryzias latipes TaxID=8090 RepID=A0A3P9J6C7_ORYLA
TGNSSPGNDVTGNFPVTSAEEDRGRVHVSRGRVHVSRGIVHISGGIVHVSRGRVHVSGGRDAKLSGHVKRFLSKRRESQNRTKHPE